MELMAEPSPTQQPARAQAACPPRWEDVLDLIERLFASGAALPTSVGVASQIAGYERGRRLMLDSEAGSQRVAVDDLRECWATFERLGRIRRQDVLDPGRCSSFVMALFAQVPGVVERTEPELHLVLSS